MMATASATQYTCNEVANEYTTNCGTCGDTTTNTESGLEKPPATLTEFQKLTKLKQWICQNGSDLGMSEAAYGWNYVTYYACRYSVRDFFGRRYSDFTPLDL